MCGVIDIGSNSIRLSVYKKTGSSGFKLLLNKKNMAGLAGFVDKRGNLSERGIRRAIAALKSYRQILDNIEVKEVYVFATASLRNIGNPKEALSAICKESGFSIDVISGEQEATFGYIGATCFMDLQDGILVDIGGGSTELAFFQEGKVQKAVSLPMGSLSLYSKYVHDILPSKKELQNIRAHIQTELSQLDLAGEYPIICGVGGSVRGSCKLCNEVFHASADNRTIPLNQLQQVLENLMEDRKYAIKKIIKTVPERIHTLIPGMTILEAIAKSCGGDCIQVSGFGVREGYLYSKLLAKEQGNDEVGSTN